MNWSMTDIIYINRTLEKKGWETYITGVDGFSILESFKHFHLYSHSGWNLLTATIGKAFLEIRTGSLLLVKQNVALFAIVLHE